MDVACHLGGCAPFLAEQATPWTDYASQVLVVWWIMGGIVRVCMPRTFAWAKREAVRRGAA